MSSDETSKPWVCPWAICPHEEAQQCRTVVRGCGGRFPHDMSAEMAAQYINRPIVTPTKEQQP